MIHRFIKRFYLENISIKIDFPVKIHPIDDEGGNVESL